MLKEKIKCLNCNKTFVPKSRNHKFCSEECGYKHYKNSYVKKTIIEEKECPYCKNKFLKKYHNQKFCSDKCSRAFYDDKYNKIITGEIENDTKSTTLPFLKMRFEVFKRDNFTCQYCGRNVKEDKIKLHLEHIIPSSKGGGDTLNNLTTSCTDCNLGKLDVLLENRKSFKNGENKQNE